MPLTQLAPPYPIFTDKNGDPLDAGFLYFGVVNQNPETQPIQVYYDSAFTQPAAQPLRTSNGYVMRNGSPALIYADSQFSVTIRDKNNALVIYSPVGFGITPGTSESFASQITVVDAGGYYSETNVEDVLQEAATGLYYNHGGTGSVARTVQGRLRDFVSVKDFGAVGDGVTDDTVAINAALDAAGDHGEVYFPYADYIVDEIGRDKVSMTGRATLIAKTGAANVVLLGRETSTFWYRTVFGLAVDGGGFSNGFTMEDIASTQETSAGRWLLENVRIENCVKGIEKLYGNISNRYSGISLTNCDFGYWAQGVTSPVVMHSGTDIFDQGHWHGCDLAAFYINDVALNGGQHVWNECIIESNPGFGIFVKNHLAQNMPITVNNCWFESNGGGGSVTIDGVSYTPKDMYFANTSLAEVNGCKFKTMQLVNSSVQMDKCFYNSNTVITLDANSSLRITNALLDDYKPSSDVVIESVANSYRGSGGTAAVFATVPRVKIEAATFSGNVLFSDNGSTPVTFTGTSSVTTTSETDGLSYTTCQELVQPASHTALHPTAFAITNGKFYVTIAELKRAATNLQAISFQDATVLCSNLQTPARSGEWSTIASVSQAATTANVRLRVRNDDTNPATLRYGALQVVEFDSYSDALSFFNSRLLVA